MYGVRRVGKYCISLVFLMIVLALTGCGKKPSDEENDDTNTKNENIKNDVSEVLEFSKKKTVPDASSEIFMSEAAKDSLRMLCQTMAGTTQQFAVAYFGYVGEPTDHPEEWIENISPQIMEDLPFIKEISEEQIVGSIGDLYCIVPRDTQGSITIRQLLDEEDAVGGAKKAGDVLYRSEEGTPVLLFCNEHRYWDRADVEITVTGADGEQVVWQPMLDEEDYVVVPQNDDGEFLAMDFTYYPERDSEPDDQTPMGWYAPELEDLAETTWTTWKAQEEGKYTSYFLDLHGGEESDYGDYDGEVSLAWLYDGDEEYQEYYEGWWSLDKVDGQVCLCLDICRIGGMMYQEGEKAQVISNQFPVLCDEECQSLILHKGLQDGESLPFLNAQTDFEFLTKSVG